MGVVRRSRQKIWRRIPVAGPWFLLFLVLASVATPLLFYHDAVLLHDEGVALTIGNEVRHGEIPYRDVYENKPPGFFYLSAAINLASPDAVIGGRLLTYAMYAFSAILIFLIGKRCWNDHVGRLAGLFFLIGLYLPLSTYPPTNTIAYGGEPIAAALLILHLYLFIRRRYMLAGGAIAAAFLIKQDAALIGLGIGVFPIVQYIRTRETWDGFYIRRLLRPPILVLAGAGMILVPVALVMYAQNMFWPAIKFVFVVAGHHPHANLFSTLYSLPSLNWYTISKITGVTTRAVFFILAGVFLETYLRGGEREIGIDYTAIFGGITAVNYFVQGGSVFSYLLAPLSLFAAAGAVSYRHRILDTSRSNKSRLSFLLLAALLVSIISSSVLYMHLEAKEAYIRDVRQDVTAYVQHQVGDDEDICTGPFSGHYHVILQRRQVTRWPGGAPGWPQHWNTTVEDLQRETPPYCIITNVTARDMFSQTLREYLNEQYRIMRSFPLKDRTILVMEKRP